MSATPQRNRAQRRLAMVAFGTNMAFGSLSGAALLRAAADTMAQDGLKFLRRSSFWLSPAWPDPADPAFVNACALVAFSAPDAASLMRQLHAVERGFGRVRDKANAPRTLDLDLIFVRGAPPGENAPSLPHPRMHDRAFVLAPLVEIAPRWRHPDLGRTARALLASAPDRAAMQRLEPWTQDRV